MVGNDAFNEVCKGCLTSDDGVLRAVQFINSFDVVPKVPSKVLGFSPSDEPRTIERPRGRARALDRRELAPLPGEGRRGDPMPLPSPEESDMGSPSVVATDRRVAAA